MTAAEKLARRFHDLYEQMAPGFGYTTREETRQLEAEAELARVRADAIRRAAEETGT